MKYILFLGIMSLSLSSRADYFCTNLSGEYEYTGDFDGAIAGTKIRLTVTQTGCEKIQIDLENGKSIVIYTDNILRVEPSFVEPALPEDNCFRAKGYWDGSKLTRENVRISNNTCYTVQDGKVMLREKNIFELVGNTLYMRDESFGRNDKRVDLQQAEFKKVR